MESDNPSDNMLISNSSSMTSSNKTDKYTARLNNVFKVSLVVNIFLLCTLIFLFIFKTFGKIDDEDAKADYVNIKMPDSGVCFPCDYLGPDVKKEDTLYDHIHMTDNGQKLCCITSLPDITTLMRKVVERQFPPGEHDYSEDSKVRESIKWWRERPHSIHMYHDTTANNLTWTIREDGLGTAFSNGIKSVDNRFVVPRHDYGDSALYFIYAAVTFDFADETYLKVVPTVYHNITRRHPNLPKTGEISMLMSKYGGSAESDRIHTSFLCGTFKLQSGYEIGSYVDSFQYVKKSTYASYFGMFRL